MATPVLSTKLFVPLPHAPAVSRPVLVERLQSALGSGRKLTLISAPAGFGKTTLLSEWIGEVRRRDPNVQVAWLSLDERDNDISRFLTYLIAALQSADAAIGTDLPDSLPVEATLTALLNEVAQANHSLILVLDDFQLIEVAPLRDAVTFLLDHLPANLHIVIASRSDPTLPLARLRSRGELTELRAADLRFAPDEATAFLNDVMGLALSPDDIAALETRTEGWIAGLQLAALSMRDRSDIAGFIEAFAGSHRFIVDYLGEEVLQRQTDQIRRFLLGTAHLDRLSGPLCDAVTGRDDSAEVLEALERDNLFIVPLDDRREWYRYHHLFADVLRARSLREDPDHVVTVHRLASEWHEAQDLQEEAVRHALAATDYNRAAVLIERALPAMRRSRQDATLFAWLAVLPDAFAEGRPVLSVYYAWSSLTSGDVDGAERRLDDAESALATTGESHHDSVGGEELRMLPVTIAVYRASIAQARGDVAGTEMHARQALALTQPGDHLGNGVASGLVGLALWAKGDIGPAIQTFSDARTSLQAAHHTADFLGSTVVMADMLVVQGRHGDARMAYEQALQIATAEGERSAADLHVGLGELCLEQGELAAATQHVEASKALGEGATLPGSRHRWFLAMARIRQAEGDLDAAQDLLREAERLYVRGFLPEIRPIQAMQARIAIVQGRLSDAAAWADQKGLSASDDVSYLHEFEHATLARLLIAQNRADPRHRSTPEVLRLLERLLTAAETQGRRGSANEILLLQALAYQAQGDLNLAMVPFARALTQTEPAGPVRLFLDEGPPVATLLNEAAHRGLTSPYVHSMRSAFASPQHAPFPAQPKGEALSERELQVLRLLATDLSGPQIARELFVSLNTFRTHTKHIFAKLSVNSRPAAARRAHEQGML
jgi:LuxR family transcriptional regulator, maltose regulon positive regulatory protein